MNKKTTSLIALGIGLTISVLGLFAACVSDSEANRPKNVVLIIVDTLRADRLGCYGYDRNTSPNIDELASGGTNFRYNHSQGTWTVPSMVSMMSGLYVTTKETALSPSHPTLAETLQSAGYETFATVANAVLANERGFERGFDQISFRGLRAVRHEKIFEAWYKKTYANLPKSDKGFFAWIHVVDPHEPYSPKPKHNVFTGVPPSRERLMDTWAASMEAMGEFYDADRAESLEESVKRMTRDSNLYDGEVLAVDEAVGTLIEFLKSQGEYEDTLIIFAADQGEMLHEYPSFPAIIDYHAKNLEAPGLADYMALGHRGWMYEEILHTPLIMSGSGIPAGIIHDSRTSNLDIYPTILHALDVAAPMELHGNSLWQNPSNEERKIFSFGYRSSAVLEPDGTKLAEYGPKFYVRGQRPYNYTPITVVLTDTNDPQVPESDLSQQNPQDVERLRQELEEWRTKYEREVISKTAVEAARALKRLGYTGD